MTNILLSYWEKLSMLGVDDAQPYGLQKRIVLSNRLSIVAMIGLFIMFSIVSYLTQHLQPLIVYLPIYCCFMSVLWLNYQGKHQTSRFIGSLAIPVIITIASILLKKNLSMYREITFYFTPRLVIFSSLVLSMVMIRPHEKIMRLSIAIITVIILLIFNPLHSYFGVGLEQVGVIPKYYHLIDVVLLFSLALLAGGVYFLLDINKTYEYKLGDALITSSNYNHELQQMNEELQSSEEELRLQTDTLLQMNDNLYQAQEHIQQLLNNSLTANKELRSTQKQLAQAEKMAGLSQLMSGIAHEINNPINFIYGGLQTITEIIDIYTNLLRRYQAMENLPNDDLAVATELLQKYKKDEEFDLDESQEDLKMLIETIKNGINRTVVIVKGLQYFSGDVKKNKRMIRVQKLVHICIDNVKAQNPSINIFLEGTIDIEFLCFVAQTEKLLTVLIENAAEAIDENGHINILIQEHENNLVITVSDNGIGIPADIQEQIFNPFFTTKEAGSNIGLGLAIAYGIVQNHAGSIELESIEGKGSKFIVTLPIAE